MLDVIRTRLTSNASIDVDEGSDPTTTSDALALKAALREVSYYGQGNLSVRVELLVYRYPSLSLVGTVPKTFTIAGTTPTQSHVDEAIRITTSMATSSFINVIGNF